MRTTKGPIARVNALLKKAGREERVIRGHGYLYLVGGIGLELGSIYVMNLEPTEADFKFLRSEVNDKFANYDRFRATNKTNVHI